MATPRGARHTDLEQRLRDLEASRRSVVFTAIASPVSTGMVEYIVPGDNVDVDATDPAHPIVSATFDAISLPTFYNTDTVTATGPGDLDLILSHVPDVGSLDVKLDGVGQPNEWTFDAPTNTVTLADPDSIIESGNVMTAEYAGSEPYTPPSATPLTALVPRATPTSTIDSGATSLALPGDTEVGDLIVVAFATSLTVLSGPGTATVTDPRLTEVSRGTWIGRADDLSDVSFANPDGCRMTVSVATFAPPADIKNQAAISGSGATTHVDCPVVASTADVLVVINESRNGAGEITSVPAGYVDLVNTNNDAPCTANIYYFVDGSASSTPAGDIVYAIHPGGTVYATAIGLEDAP